MLRRTVWYASGFPGARGVSLFRIDFGAPVVAPRVVIDHVPVFTNLVPDLNGGLWIANRDSVRRVDAAGRIVVSVVLNRD